MAKRYPWRKHYMADSLTDTALSRCSPATRGVFWDWVDTMHLDDSPTLKGTVEQLARCGRCSPEEARRAIEELDTHGVAQITVTDDVFQVKHKRVGKDLATRRNSRSRKRKQREREKCPDNVTHMSRACHGVESESDPEVREEEHRPPEYERPLVREPWGRSALLALEGEGDDETRRVCRALSLLDVRPGVIRACVDADATPDEIARLIEQVAPAARQGKARDPSAMLASKLGGAYGFDWKRAGAGRGPETPEWLADLLAKGAAS